MSQTTATPASVFGPILASITQQPQQLRMAAYVSALQAHDWSYEWSDDGDVWRRGRDQRAVLKSMQAELDPTGSVWNQHAPAEYAIEVAA